MFAGVCSVTPTTWYLFWWLSTVLDWRYVHDCCDPYMITARMVKRCLWKKLLPLCLHALSIVGTQAMGRQTDMGSCKLCCQHSLHHQSMHALHSNLCETYPSATCQTCVEATFCHAVTFGRLSNYVVNQLQQATQRPSLGCLKHFHCKRIRSIQYHI